MMHRFSWVWMVLSGMYACRHVPGGGSVVTVRLVGALHRTVRMETLPIAGEAVRVLDTVRVGSNDATMTFRIAEPEELACRLQVPGSDFTLPFILHPGPIHIEGHFILPPEMASVRSSVNTPHDAFLDRRADAWQRAAERMELAGGEADASVRARQLLERDSILAAREREAFRYADTVSHPGAFLHAYAFLDQERRLQPWLDVGRLKIVNIALEGEKDTWRFFTATRQVPGLHLIDTGGWEGPVIRRWRIDSIPFNWLIGLQGRILRKAIPADSLYDVVKRTLGSARGRAGRPAG